MNDTGTRIKIENRRSSKVSENQPASTTSCPEYEGQIVQQRSRGEAACKKCGLVLEEDTIDRVPEWRAFYAEERDEKSRVGAPKTQLIHDKELSTTISRQDKDPYGQSVSGQKRARLQRLRTWNERFRTKDAHEQNLKQALREISRMASALDLPEPVCETAGILYRRAVKEDLLPGRSIEGISTAALYVAARQHGMPHPLSKFATVSRVEKIRIQRAYRYLSHELELTIEPEDPAQYLPQFASSLEVSDEAERRSRELLDAAKATGTCSGKSPAGLAAAALYATTHLTNEQLTRETVSEVAHVSQVTIRNRYRELLEVYGNYQTSQ